MRSLFLLLISCFLALPVTAQTPAKTPMQQAGPIIDTLAARMAKLVRDVEAAGSDMGKVRELDSAYHKANERLEGQLEALKAQMNDAEKQELQIYSQLKMGKLPGRLTAVTDKAKEQAAAKAAAAGPLAIKKTKAEIAQLGEEADALAVQLRKEGSNPEKREAIWQKVMVWEGKRHATIHGIRRNPDILQPEPLEEEAESVLRPRVTRLDRLHRLVALPPCAQFEAELKAAESRVKAVSELHGVLAKAGTLADLEAARTQRERATNAALEASYPELTVDEAAEVLATVQEWLEPVNRKLDEAAEKSAAKIRKSE